MIIQGIGPNVLFIGEVETFTDGAVKVGENGYICVKWPMLYGEAVPASPHTHQGAAKMKVVIQSLSYAEATPLWYVKIGAYRPVTNAQVLEHYQQSVTRERARDAGLVSV